MGGRSPTNGDGTAAPSGRRPGRQGIARQEVRARRATIRDVAELAGVSVGTASKALNGQGKLRAESISLSSYSGP